MKIFFSLIVASSLIPGISHACDASTPAGMANCISLLNTATNGPGPDCAPIAQNCKKTVDRLTKDGELNVTMAFGYADVAGSGYDGVQTEYYANSMIEMLTTPCPTNFQNDWSAGRSGTPEEVNAVHQDLANGCGGAKLLERTCGFMRTDDPEILIKQLVIDGKTVAVKTRIISSTISDSDKVNRDNKSKFVADKFCASAKAQKSACISTNAKSTPAQLALKCTKGDERKYQICRTEYAKKAWQSSIVKGDEIISYIGHARDGGGPSFEPPRVLPNGHVDYAWYRKVRPGHALEAEALRQSVAKGKSPVFYGSYSCNGIVNFYDNGQMPEASPATSYVLSKRISYFDEDIAAQIALLEGAFNGKCGAELDKDVQNISCAFRVREGKQ